MPASLRRASIALALLAVAAIAAARADAAPGGPDSHTQPLLDGCQRSQSLTLAVSTPEWVYVNASSVRMARLTGDETAGRRSVYGLVVESRPAGEDLYINHDFSDYNLMVVPDAAYADVLGTGNVQTTNPREQNVIEGEWETHLIPLWARPSRGDRVRMSGNWIWDCGHWGNSAADPTGLSQLLVYDPIETIQDLVTPGVIRGETTELHPMYEATTFRADAAGPLTGFGARRLSALDVWLNGDGGPAHSTEECALRGVPNAVVAKTVCSPHRDVGGTYSYTLPLRPKPSSSSQLVVNPLVVHPETAPSLATIPVSITPDANNGTVGVSFTLPHSPVSQRFGISVTAGWSDDEPAVRHSVTIDAIHISGGLDGATEPNLNPGGIPGEQVTEPGEWVLYANVSGHWIQIPKITQVHDGDDIALGIPLTFYLPQGITPTLYVSGHECDEPLLDCVHEGPGNAAAFPGSLELGFNDRPGRIQNDRYGVPLVLGTSTYHPPANPDPNAGNEDLSDAICGPLGCYLLTVTWRAGA